MKNLKFYLLALLSSAFALSFTGCGDDDEEDSSSSESIVGSWVANLDESSSNLDQLVATTKSASLEDEYSYDESSTMEDFDFNEVMVDLMGESDTITFTADGKYLCGTVDGTYKIDGNKLSITTDLNGKTFTLESNIDFSKWIEENYPQYANLVTLTFGDVTFNVNGNKLNINITAEMTYDPSKLIESLQMEGMDFDITDMEISATTLPVTATLVYDKIQ